MKKSFSIFNTNKNPLSILVWLGFLIAIMILLLAYGNTPGIARTPPENDLEKKPDAFLIQLPFGAGVTSDLGYYSYESPHSAHSGLDKYAIDFDLDGATVYPIASGTVVWKDWQDQYGNIVWVHLCNCEYQ